MPKSLFDRLVKSAEQDLAARLSNRKPPAEKNKPKQDVKSNGVDEKARAKAEGKEIRVSVRVRYSESDVVNAGRMIALHGAAMRYCHPWKKWLVWDGKRWAIDNTGAALRLAKRVAESAVGEAIQEDEQPRSRHAADVAFHRRLKTMLLLAAPELPILPEELDRDPWLLNCENGTLDLRTGELREHRPEDFITKLCPTAYHPDAKTDEWDRFLASILVHPSHVEFMQTFFGYCLTGDVREQFVPIIWGEGSNGKSVLMEAFMQMLGHDYAMKAPPDLLIVKKHGAHPSERADFFGKRFVACVESGQSRQLNETFVKELTGGDRIRARRLYENNWEFSPTHKVVLCTNHCPEVRGTDHAIWRRLALVQFPVTFWDPDKGEKGPEECRQDKSLPQRLKDAAEGILAASVQGCLAWQRDGLKLPVEIVAATQKYRYSEDIVAAFIEEQCVVHPECKVLGGSLYSAYEFWCVFNGRRDIGNRQFGENVAKRFQKFNSNGLYYKGIGLAKDYPKLAAQR